MAPSIDNPANGVTTNGNHDQSNGETQGKYDIRTSNSFADGAFLNIPDPSVNASNYRYAHYLPVFDKSVHLPPLEPFEHVDPGSRVSDPLNNPLKNLFDGIEWKGVGNQIDTEKGVSIKEVTPTIGSEIEGIQLSKLSKEGMDELGVLVARRKVVVFRDQDFGDEKDLNKVKDYGRHFGRLHIHPTSGHPENHPEFHLVYRDGQSSYNFEQSDRLSSVTWHSDVTYEEQPPGTSFFWILDQPPSGGDTLFANMVEAYNRLSEPFKKRLEGLEAVHSGVEQAEYSRAGKRGGVVRRDPVENVHPVVRTHPVTGERALFVNKQFTRRIVGFKREESEYLLNFLFDHIAKGCDFHARIKWTPGAVSIWDNRITSHTAILDFQSQHRRHAARLTPQAEKPFYR